MDMPFTRLVGVELPIVQAPMAGGYTTPELVAAVSNAGGLGGFAATLLRPEDIGPSIDDIRARTRQPFAVNLFLPEPPPPVAEEQLQAAAAALAAPAKELGIEPPRPVRAPQLDFAQQFAAVLAARPPVASFVMGCPSGDQVRQLQRAGIKVLGTATGVAEAQALAAAGVDAVVAQGSEAGGHRAAFPGGADGMLGTLTLTQQIAAALVVPVVAAGGIMDGRGIAAALMAGAAAAQLGTAFLAAGETGTPETLRAALVDLRQEPTVVTRAFTGKPARVIKNRFVELVDRPGAAILPWPLQGPLTLGIRRAALQQGRRDLMFLLAGQGLPFMRALPAAALMRDFLAGWRAAAKRLAAG